MSQSTAPMPDLRIIEIDRLRAHEVHDSQRSEPLTERLRLEPTIINPPVVAPLPGGDFVILDGANRAFALRAIGCPHVLVQVTTYREGGVELSIWRHVVANWDAATLLDRIGALPNVQIVPRREPSDEPEPGALATITTFAGERWTVLATGPDAVTNAPLRSLVHIYQSQATLQRTALADNEEIWRYHPEAAALLTFRHYQPEDIMQAALTGDFLPPGVSRHIVHGRAIRVNYPMVDLRDLYTPLERKNEALRRWTQEKIAARRVRFYAESTFQFDE